MAYDFRHAFGPGQITGVAIVPGEYFVVDELRNFSISSHFDKAAIRRLGHRLPVGWATGSGTIAGTLIFAQLTRGAFWRLRRYAGTVRVAQGRSLDTPQQEWGNVSAMQSGIRPEQLPPFELMFVHASESGQMAISRLYDVTITDTGSVKGQGNRFTEEQLQYKARFHEQIRLHRSLTTGQMVELANEAGADKKRGFFNDPRKSNALLDQLMNVSGIDTGDLGEYLIAETEEVEEGGAPAAMEIADTGNVVFQKPPDDHSEPTGRSPDLAAAQQKGRHYIHEIEETLIVEDGGGAFSTETLTAYLELKGDRLFLSSDHIDDTENHTPVASAAGDGVPVTLSDRDYYGTLLENSSHEWPDVRFRPPFVSLAVTERSVRRAADLPDVDAGFTEKVPAGPYDGINEGLAPNVAMTREFYRVTSGGDLEVVATPPGGPAPGTTAPPNGDQTFDLSGIPYEYVPEHKSLKRAGPLGISGGSGSVTKHAPNHWTWSHSATENGEDVLRVEADLKAKSDGTLEVTFTDLFSETYSREVPVQREGQVEIEQGVLSLSVSLSKAPNGPHSYEFDAVSASFSSEELYCPSRFDASATGVEIGGTWRGRSVDVTVETGGSYTGTVAGVSVNGTGWQELVGVGAGVQFKATSETAELRLTDREVSA